MPRRHRSSWSWKNDGSSCSLRHQFSNNIYLWRRLLRQRFFYTHLCRPKQRRNWGMECFAPGVWSWVNHL